jgi:hypothetical protein
MGVKEKETAVGRSFSPGKRATGSLASGIRKASAGVGSTEGL